MASGCAPMELLWKLDDAQHTDALAAAPHSAAERGVATDIAFASAVNMNTMGHIDYFADLAQLADALEKVGRPKEAVKALKTSIATMNKRGGRH